MVINMLGSHLPNMAIVSCVVVVAWESTNMSRSHLPNTAIALDYIPQVYLKMTGLQEAPTTIP